MSQNERLTAISLQRGRCSACALHHFRLADETVRGAVYLLMCQHWELSEIKGYIV